MGLWSAATDGYDVGYDILLTSFNEQGYVGVRHVNGGEGWTGATGYYRTDCRAPIAADERRTWEPVHFWAGPVYSGPVMYMALEPDEDYPPPATREYTLELLYVPSGVTGAPPVGTIWTLAADALTLVELPTYQTSSGGDGAYRLSFSISAESVRGDADCDGDVDYDDIDAFVAAIGGRSSWAGYLGGSPACGYLLSCDIDGNGQVDYGDIDPFVACLSGNCPE